MVNTLLNGGPFMMVLIALAGIIIFISVKNINEPYNTNGIVLLGIFSALVGILSTYLGVNAAFSAVPDINSIAPQILINGLNAEKKGRELNKCKLPEPFDKEKIFGDIILLPMNDKIEPENIYLKEYYELFNNENN